MAFSRRPPTGLGLLPAQFSLSALRTPVGGGISRRMPPAGAQRPAAGPGRAADPLAGLVKQATSRFRGGTPIGARGRGPQVEGFTGLANGQGTVGGPGLVPPSGQGPMTPSGLGADISGRLGGISYYPGTEPWAAPDMRTLGADILNRLGGVSYYPGTEPMPPGTLGKSSPSPTPSLPPPSQQTGGTASPTTGPSSGQQMLGLIRSILGLGATGSQLVGAPGTASALGGVAGPLGIAQGVMQAQGGQPAAGALRAAQGALGSIQPGSRLWNLIQSMGPSAISSLAPLSSLAIPAALAGTSAATGFAPFTSQFAGQQLGQTAGGATGGSLGALGSALPYAGLAAGIGLGAAQGGGAGATQAAVTGAAPLLAMAAGMGPLAATGAGLPLAILPILTSLLGGGSSAIGRERNKDINQTRGVIENTLMPSLQNQLQTMAPRIQTQGDVDWLWNTMKANIREQLWGIKPWASEEDISTARIPNEATFAGFKQFLDNLRATLPEGPVTGLQSDKGAQEKWYAEAPAIHEASRAAEQAQNFWFSG